MPRALRKITSVSAEAAAETGGATPEEPAGMHSADVHVPDYLEGFGIAMPLLAAIINGISEGSRRARRSHHRKYLSASLERAHMLSKAPTKVDPSASFAQGSCCLVVVGSDGVVRIMPGGDRRTFKRTHRTDILGAAFAQRWARFLSLRDDLQISQQQTAELAAWCELTGAKSLKRAPAVAFVFLAAPVRSADS